MKSRVREYGGFVMGWALALLDESICDVSRRLVGLFRRVNRAVGYDSSVG